MTEPEQVAEAVTFTVDEINFLLERIGKQEAELSRLRDQVAGDHEVLREFFTSGDFDIEAKPTEENKRATEAWLMKARARLASVQGGE
jgi:hypothetical protein